MPRPTDLGPLELRIVGLFDAHASLGVQEVQAELAKAGHELAYTTVMTVLGRLHDKRMLVREKEGRRFVYALAKRAPAVTQGIVARLHRTLFGSDRARPILALLEDERLSDEELRALREAIDERLRGRP